MQSNQSHFNGRDRKQRIRLKQDQDPRVQILSPIASYLAYEAHDVSR